MRLVHVGLGGWGRDWERTVLPRVPEVDRVAVVEPDRAVLSAFQRTAGLPDAACATTLAQALRQVEADGVLVTAPVGAHVPLALEALEAGLHVLVEKPFAPTAAEASTAVTRAEQLGLVLQVSQNYRFYPGPRATRDLLRGGDLGELSGVAVDFRKWSNDAPATTPHYRFPQPLLVDMAIHHVDLLRFVTGREVERVHAVTSSPSWSRFAEPAVASVLLELTGGLVASYRGSWLSRGRPTPWAGEWSITGERGELLLASRHGGEEPPVDDSLVLRGADGDEAALPLELPRLWGRAAGLQQFARAAAGGPPPEVTGRDNLASLAAVEATVRSSQTGQVEDVVVPG
ncbi:Gfo/Idh/MocA family protein [Quadrisphaera setariae]|uniref:Gfo/Idh/MocA family oxidoreductase n=1 Tax=Quadrisphaera setariae TaxID=2593304 RepID=A0A5C8ZD12_9ACTN|nr:Gfo/Idh/MocA family oxidoreductase [Quadrisphaera setariae]TXR55169.1 Gfo/Idh/MocA family oxidoreductase [Quadrisphaera setariae]